MFAKPCEHFANIANQSREYLYPPFRNWTFGAGLPDGADAAQRGESSDSQDSQFTRGHLEDSFPAFPYTYVHIEPKGKSRFTREFWERIVKEQDRRREEGYYLSLF